MKNTFKPEKDVWNICKNQIKFVSLQK
jgi:hypothetical protein